jgi:hypothetical protein
MLLGDMGMLADGLDAPREARGRVMSQFHALRGR